MSPYEEGGSDELGISEAGSKFNFDGCVDPRGKDEEEAERNKLNAMRAFYSITLGGARGVYLEDKIGSFDPGKEADFVVLDWTGGPMATRWHQSLIVKD
jgi:guanine deaminase